MLMTSAANAVIIGATRPFNSERRNRNEFGQELLILFILYHVLCFTNFVLDEQMRHYIGYSVIVCSLLHIAIFYIVQTYLLIKYLQQELNWYYWKKQARADIKRRITEQHLCKNMIARRIQWAKEAEKQDELGHLIG